MRTGHQQFQHHLQRGTALIVSMLMMLIILLLGTAMANIALTDERAARNARDRVIAMHAAELALADAEQDIENSTDSASRSAMFSADSSVGFTENCGRGRSNIYQGLCSIGSSAPFATSAELANADDDSASVEFGRFTGHTMATGNGPLPCRLPRYVIELILDNSAAQTANARFMYRITALGFGPESRSQVTLQSVYRKAGSNRKDDHASSQDKS